MKPVSIEVRRDLNDCGCCAGLTAFTPVDVYNRPGLAAIAYRAGTHPHFLQTLLARLSTSDQSSLKYLNTRETDDFSIALLDTWAVVADVLTFYQERIANESYLRTASERRSVLELARMIGYELGPGVAASTYLAFTIEDAKGAFGPIQVNTSTDSNPPGLAPTLDIEIGTKVRSVPGPGEEAQTFETIEKIEARAEWNSIKPRMTQFELSTGSNCIFIKDTTTRIEPGDLMLIVDETNIKAKFVRKVRPDEDADVIRIDFKDPPDDLPAYIRPNDLSIGKPGDFPDGTTLDNAIVKSICKKTWKEEDLVALANTQNWSLDDLVRSIDAQVAQEPLQDGSGVYVLRQRANIFGYNAAKQVKYNGELVPLLPEQWQEWTLENIDRDKIHLSNANSAILPDSYIAIQRPGQAAEDLDIMRVQKVEIRPRTAYGLSSETTVLTIPDNGQQWLPPASPPDDLSVIRDIAVYVQSEQLPLAELPIEDPLPIRDPALTDDLVDGDVISLNRMYLGLKKGQRIIISGELCDPEGIYTNEICSIREVLIEQGFTVIKLEKNLANRYVRKTVSINANIAKATHGETVQEILGGGDTLQTFQRFSLRQPPLTHVSADNPSGARTTLEIRANDLLWQEVGTFHGKGPNDRIYITRTDNEGNTAVIFGDGKTGVRPPSGQENIRAKYRKGLGLSGQVKAQQLTQLMTRPLGVKEVTNPVAANGAADPELLENARRNAPLTILTLDRVVSLQDFEDYAMAFAGIEKALATWTWFGKQRGVFITVAGPNGAQIKHDSIIHENFKKALRNFGGRTVPVTVESYQPKFFRLAADISVHPDYLVQKVLDTVIQKLRENFEFESRNFGQFVYRSEVYSIIQNIEGVESVTVKELYRTDHDPEINSILEAALPQPGGITVFPAELLTLDPGPLNLEIVE